MDIFLVIFISRYFYSLICTYNELTDNGIHPFGQSKPKMAKTEVASGSSKVLAEKNEINSNGKDKEGMCCFNSIF